MTTVIKCRSQAVLWIVWAVVAAGVLTYSVAASTHSFPDEREYIQLATSIATGQGYELVGNVTAYRPPVWPLLLAAGIAAGIPAAAITLLSGACLIGASIAARTIAARVAGPSASWLAAFGMLAYPLNVYTAATAYPQTLTTLLFLAPVAIMLHDRVKVFSYAVAGLCLAGLVLAAPTMSWTALLIAIWAWYRNGRSKIGYSILIGLATVAPITVWTLRNYATFRAFIPVSTATGVNLLLGNNPHATATTGVGADISAYSAAARGLSEVAQDRYFATEAFVWILSNPARAAVLYTQKVANYFAAYNSPYTSSAGSLAAAAVAWATFVPVLILALSRFSITRRLPIQSPEKLLWIAFATNALFMAITFTRTRFRQPLDAVLIIEAAIFVAVAASAWRGNRRRPRSSQTCSSAI